MILNRKQFGRLREIGAVLLKHGWGHIVTKLGLADIFHYRGRPRHVPDAPARLLKALEELGPTFIKLGQLLSTRSDLLPPEYIVELSKLQDAAPTIPLSQIRSIIEDELERPVAAIYPEFIDEPIAAASLGQVHAASLVDGSQVIVKVQRPGIGNQVENDIQILYFIARFLEGRWERARTYGLTDVVDEFAITIREELDYLREGHNTERLKDNLSREKDVRLPKVYWSLTSQRVLTLERIEGVKTTDLAALDKIGVDRISLANKLISIFLKQLLVDGFFHADPHPGNILVTSEHELALIDAGQVRQLDSGARGGLIRLLIAFELRNTREFADEIVVLGISRGEVDLPSLTHDLEKLLRQYYDLPARATNVGQILMRVMDVSARHRIRLPTGFTVVGKVLATIDGINRQLNPDWNFTEAARPYISLAVRRQLSSEGILLECYRALMDTKNFIFELPEHMGQIIRKAVEGSLRIEFRHRGLDEFASRLDRVANRLIFALVTGAIIIGSSIIVVSGQGPTSLFGLPVFGVAGYLIAMVLGVSLLISIIRSGKL